MGVRLGSAFIAYNFSAEWKLISNVFWYGSCEKSQNSACENPGSGFFVGEGASQTDRGSRILDSEATPASRVSGWVPGSGLPGGGGGWGGGGGGGPGSRVPRRLRDTGFPGGPWSRVARPLTKHCLCMFTLAYRTASSAGTRIRTNTRALC